MFNLFLRYGNLDPYIYTAGKEKVLKHLRLEGQDWFWGHIHRYALVIANIHNNNE